MAEVEQETMRLTRLEIRNFQRVRGGVWDLTDGLNRLTSGGKNRQGKTTVLRAIRTLFEGEGAVPEVPINLEADLSEDEAVIRGWLSNGWTLRRTFTEKGTYLQVVGPDGGKHGANRVKPWFGGGSFDPLSFFAMRPAAQAEALLGLASDPNLKEKLDANAAREAALREERTPVLSERNRLRSVPKPEGERPEEVSTDAEMGRMGELQAKERERQDALRAVQRADDLHVQAGRHEFEAANRVKELQAHLARAEEVLEDRRAATAEAEAALAVAQEHALTLPDVSDAIAEVHQRIRSAEAVQRSLEPWRAWERAQEDLEGVVAEAARLTAAIEATKEEREQLIASAEFPIPGLDFTADGTVILNGLPLDQASGRERVELAVLAAAAANPSLRTILVDEGNDIDAEGMERLVQLAEEHDLQPIVARLGLEGAGELEVVDGWGPLPEADVDPEAS